MAYPVTYSCQHQFMVNPSYGSGHLVSRPWVEVTAALSGHRHRVWCLVDTGADDTILDLGTAAVLGIVVASLPQTSVTSVTSVPGGTTKFGLHTGVSLSFAGTTVTPHVLFGVVAVPLLGRSALLNMNAGVKTGFDPAKWLHT